MEINPRRGRGPIDDEGADKIREELTVDREGRRERSANRTETEKNFKQAQFERSVGIALYPVTEFREQQFGLIRSFPQASKMFTELFGSVHNYSKEPEVIQQAFGCSADEIEDFLIGSEANNVLSF